MLKNITFLECENFDDEIFKGFVREFFKIKLESKGFDKDNDTPEKQDKFLQECYEIFGLKVDK